MNTPRTFLPDTCVVATAVMVEKAAAVAETAAVMAERAEVEAPSQLLR
jgi:hypothetical protein